MRRFAPVLVFALAAACQDSTEATPILDVAGRDSGGVVDAGRDSTADATVAVDASSANDGSATDGGGAGATDAGGADDANARDANSDGSDASADTGAFDVGSDAWEDARTDAAPLPLPLAGELVISEINYNGANVAALSENDFEWFEVTNRSNKVLTLNGLIVDVGTVDAPKSFMLVADLSIEPGAYKVLAFNAGASRVPAAHLFAVAATPYSYGDAQVGRTLVNSGAPPAFPRLALRTLGGLVDEAIYGMGNFFVANQQTIQRKNFAVYAQGAAFEGTKWCKSLNDWQGGNVGDRGTPGAPSDCP